MALATGLVPNFLEQVLLALEENGALATALPGFAAREQQSQMAASVVETIQNTSILLAEAGTGTGKTFAYLVPSLLSDKKILISTATKTLQDQLVQKDLPLLLKALGLSRTLQNLKGRANYLCLERIEQHADESRYLDLQLSRELRLIQSKLPRLIEGDRHELPEIQEQSAVWPYVTSTVDNCLANACPKRQSCYLMRARKKAQEAQVLVINHHLFFADSRLKAEGFGELLPDREVLIFDEAHQLVDIAADFFEARLGSRQLEDLIFDLKKNWPNSQSPIEGIEQACQQIQASIASLFRSLLTKEERLAWAAMQRNQEFSTALDNLSSAVQALVEALSDQDLGTVISLIVQRLRQHQVFFQQLPLWQKERILWLERFKQSFVIHASPLSFAEDFQKLLATPNASFIFTSATLSSAGSFDAFKLPLGIEKSKTLFLASPFCYAKQALLYLPRNLPDPREPNYAQSLVTAVLPLILAIGGRSFMLFTSHRALQQTAEILRDCLDFPLLVQGEESKAILLARFREYGNAVLLGTASFWEGVDVRGEALSCVIIDKIPFASPKDPLTCGRMSYLKSQGLSPFYAMTLPNAIVALKQGAGRLIRDREDRGVLVLADPRLTARDYGRMIFDSLPAMPRTRDPTRVLTFIECLALHHEYSCDG